MNNREKVIEKYVMYFLNVIKIAEKMGDKTANEGGLRNMLEKFLEEIHIADSPQGPEDVEPIKEKESICEKNCPDYKGMAILHEEKCVCSCHSKNKRIEEIKVCICRENESADPLKNHCTQFCVCYCHNGLTFRSKINEVVRRVNEGR